VRVIAATHRNLKALAAVEKFRCDLYYRLNVFRIHLPPLRQRGEDLPLLLRHFMRRFSRELGRDVTDAAPETLARLREWSWPGNVRELQGVLKQAILNASGTVLLPAFLPDLSARPVAPGAGGDSPPDVDLETFIRQRFAPDSDDVYGEIHREVDRKLISVALEYTRGNHRRAARILGISRQTLRTRFRTLGLHVVHSVEAN